MTKVKICCIQSLAEGQMELDAGADALGLVAEMPSGPGPIPDRDIRDIAAALPDAFTILLSSRTRLTDLVQHIARCCSPKAIQLVDAVLPEVRTGLKNQFSELTIISVVHVTGNDCIADALTTAATSDMILLDSGSIDGPVKELGGTGRTHNWDISAEIVQQSPVPVWLAGGLRPDNIRAAIKAVNPYGVNLCSSLRPNGPLDQALLDQFIRNANA